MNALEAMAPAPAPRHLLVYEPRTEGHHLGWLRFIVGDLLDAGVRLSLAADLRPGRRERLEEQLGDLLPRVRLWSAYDERGRRHLDGKARSVAHCFVQSGADQVFLCALDEIASSCWRRATLGIDPPAVLRGRIGGIYHRPRFLRAPPRSFDRWSKAPGFARLLAAGWWRQIVLLDEFLAADLAAAHRQWPIHFLPDPCPADYESARTAARERLGLPADRYMFLFYGTGARRKGLHLAVEAMRSLVATTPAFLLCAGEQRPRGRTAADLAALAGGGQALLLDRYVSDSEERDCFAACDAVLLPYLNHFGTSGVLSRAMAAARPVIVSDEQLLGHLTRAHGLGFTFASGRSDALAAAMTAALRAAPAEVAQFEAAAGRYAARYSRAAFKTQLLRSLGVA
ncbi:MAG: glycosyltransferase [Betaproteobacteria bacterium]